MLTPACADNGAGSTATFQNRYLINDTWWTGPTSPIVFYTGNEGDIELFAQNTGHQWQFAEQVGALVVFCEHRYYGQSMPFGDASYNTSNLAYLSSEQALMDFVDLIASLKANYSAPNAPVIAWGGSYGGMLTAW